MGADLRRRIEAVEAGFGPPVVFGIWTHDNGRPTYHRLSGLDLDLDRWLRTGELPKGTEFMGVIAIPESERLWRSEPERIQPWEFVPTDEQLHEGWKSFPELHPKTLEQLEKMRQVGFYSFIDGQLRGMNGPLPPKEQRRELYPYG